MQSNVVISLITLNLHIYNENNKTDNIQTWHISFMRTAGGIHYLEGNINVIYLAYTVDTCI